MKSTAAPHAADTPRSRAPTVIAVTLRRERKMRCRNERAHSICMQKFPSTVNEGSLQKFSRDL
jgi:hypothetical protein